MQLKISGNRSFFSRYKLEINVLYYSKLNRRVCLSTGFKWITISRLVHRLIQQYRYVQINVWKALLLSDPHFLLEIVVAVNFDSKCHVKAAKEAYVVWGNN